MYLEIQVCITKILCAIVVSTCTASDCDEADKTLHCKEYVEGSVILAGRVVSPHMRITQMFNTETSRLQIAHIPELPPISAYRS